MEPGRILRAARDVIVRRAPADPAASGTRQTNSAWSAVAQRAPDAASSPATTTPGDALQAVTNDTAVRVIGLSRALAAIQASLKDGAQQVAPELIAGVESDLALIKAEASRYDGTVPEGAERERMVATVDNYAILAEVVRGLRDDHFKKPLSATKVEMLRLARLRVICEFREERSIPNSSQNEIYRDAEYYLVGRFEALDIAPDSAAVKVGVGTGGVALNVLYNTLKRVVNMQQAKGFPTSKPGGSAHTFAGSLDATDEKASDMDIPAILAVMPKEHRRQFGLPMGPDAPVRAPPFFPGPSNAMPRYDDD